MSEDEGDRPAGTDRRGNVLPFPDRRVRRRRADDMSDEWLRMVLSSMEKRLTLLEQGQHVDDLKRRVQELEQAQKATGGQVTAWRAQLGLIVFCVTSGAGTALVVLRLMGKI